MVTQGWKIDKHIPVAVIITIIMQTFGAIWWASAVEGRLNDLEEKQEYVRVRDGRIRQLENDVGRMEERLKNIDNTTKRIEYKLDKISQGRGTKASYRPAVYFSMSIKELTQVNV